MTRRSMLAATAGAIAGGLVARPSSVLAALAGPPAPALESRWLGALPAEGGQRPPLNGTLNQETYIRVMIPVPKVIAK